MVATPRPQTTVCPFIPRARRRLSAYPVSAARKDEDGTNMKESTLTPPPPRRRLRKKTCVASHRQSQEEQPDELDVLLAGAPSEKLIVSRDAQPTELDGLLAGAPGGKLVVSRGSYHDLPPSARGAFKR